MQREGTLVLQLKIWSIKFYLSGNLLFLAEEVVGS
jgi:hypothetical protein